MKEPIHEEKYKSYVISIFNDENSESPAEWGNNDVCFWSSRNLWQENPHINVDIFRSFINPKEYPDYKQEAKELKKKYHIFGLDAYIHSGIALNFHNEGYRCQFDTTDYIGCVLVEKNETKSPKKAKEIAKGIMETWQDYLDGDIYGYKITKENWCDKCGHIENEDPEELTINSRWGFYGDYEENALKAAKEEIDSITK